MSELPEGFVLDATAPAAAPHGLPDGFVLDGATAAAPKPASTWENFKAGIGAIFNDPSKLAQVGPGRIVGQAVGAVTLPGDVATGKVDPFSDEGIGRAADLAMFASPGAPRVASAPAAAVPAAAPVVSPLIEASERIGVELPRAVASDSRAVQAAGAGLSNVPFVGTPLMKGAEKAIKQIGTAADEVAAGYGASTVPEAGGAARKAIETGWKGRTTANKDKLYGRVDELVNPQAVAPLEATRSVVADIAARRAAERVSDPGKASSFVLDAVQDPNGLTYEGIKGLRTRVGEMLKDKNALASQGVSERELEAVYKGLSEDLRGAVQKAGGDEALSAFNAANSYAANVAERQKRLQPIVGATSDEGVLERIVAAAASKGRADIQLLSQARKAIGPEAWEDIAGAAVARMGRDVEGQFSPQRFLTDFGKLSAEGKAILFNSTGKGDLSRALTDIATVSGRFKELEKFANRSGTGRQTVFSQGLLGSGVGTGVAGALFMEPVTTITSVLGAGVAAKVLASPQTASSMARWARAYEAAAKAPSAATAAGLKIATRNFGATIESRLGIPNPANDIMGTIGGGSKAAASGSQPQEPE